MATPHEEMPEICVICDAHNSPAAVVCKECAAPVSLSRDAAVNRQDLRTICILGDSNSGKTIYLGFLLDILSQRAGDFDSVPKAAHVVDAQQAVMSYMALRMFPPKTPMETTEWTWAYHQVTKRGRKPKCVDLVMPDFAGEAISAEVGSPLTFRVIHNLLAMSSGVILLVDSALAANGSMKPDFSALKTMVYIDNMFSGRRKKRIDMPIAVVLSKADYCPECFDNPRRFVHTNMNRFWNICEKRFSNVAFFASSVVGSLGYATSPEDGDVIPIPLHTALNGVLEPFEWTMDQI